MAWDFSIEGVHTTTIRQRLLRGITEHWTLKKDTQTNLLALYQMEGLTATFFNRLSDDLYQEASLNLEQVLRELGFEEQYALRSKQVNYAMNQVFFHWLETFRTVEEKNAIKVCDSSALLSKEDLVELLDWVALCSCLLAQETVPAYYNKRHPALLEEAKRYCAQVKDYEEMAYFALEWSNYQHFQEELRTCLFDLFYWWNSY